ncbi:hypothetical protein [Protaetiibacter larvae]|uniref:Uncharacterized protein n=1 Tax=Protaetiibacter larvae TaxID=2592654 RepID=A0A5C1Y4D8_9MICO|nr:hypothetical protein [Protaetiibacter larvae]QEO08883.1 hypothetical protein FLP23_01910 [Protaetiibacter larvae]
MAIGDKAAAKGLYVVEATDDHAVGYQDINRRGDELADEIDARAAGDAAAFPASKIIISDTFPAVVNGGLLFKVV